MSSQLSHSSLRKPQISQELQASQVYLSLSAWAGHVNQALPGLEKFFKESAEEEREHAQKLIDYQNRRGGKVVLQTLQAPECDWSSARNAIESTLQLEKGNVLRFFLTPKPLGNFGFFFHAHSSLLIPWLTYLPYCPRSVGLLTQWFTARRQSKQGGRRNEGFWLRGAGWLGDGPPSRVCDLCVCVCRPITQSLFLSLSRAHSSFFLGPKGVGVIVRQSVTMGIVDVVSSP